MKHVMIDIETMGTGNDAALISLGATKFDPAGSREVLDSFYVPISLESSMTLGLKATAGTIMWWLDEERAPARKVLLSETPVDLISALDGFVQWYGGESLPTWGNGATFDNVIVRHALTQCGFECPWKFWDDRCFRTLKNIHPLVTPVAPPEGVAHHALYDAIMQTYQLQAIYKQMLGHAVSDDHHAVVGG